MFKKLLNNFFGGPTWILTATTESF